MGRIANRIKARIEEVKASTFEETIKSISESDASPIHDLVVAELKRKAKEEEVVFNEELNKLKGAEHGKNATIASGIGTVASFAVTYMASEFAKRHGVTVPTEVTATVALGVTVGITGIVANLRKRIENRRKYGSK